MSVARDFLDEVCRYGGVLMRRADVYALCLEHTGNKRCADFFAFGGARADGEPTSLDEARRLLGFERNEE